MAVNEDFFTSFPAISTPLIPLYHRSVGIVTVEAPVNRPYKNIAETIIAAQTSTHLIMPFISGSPAGDLYSIKDATRIKTIQPMYAIKLI